MIIIIAGASLTSECVIRNSPVVGLVWETKTTLKLEKVGVFPVLKGFPQNSKK